jgi:hypothetical protein
MAKIQGILRRAGWGTNACPTQTQKQAAQKDMLRKMLAWHAHYFEALALDVHVRNQVGIGIARF